MTHTAYFVGRVEEAELLRRKLFATKKEYDEQNALMIRAITQTVIGHRFNLVILSVQAERFMLDHYKPEQRDQIIDHLRCRLLQGGKLLRESEL